MPSGNSYRKIKEHIAQIAKDCQRDPDDITLVAVSKNFSWEHIESAYETGCRDFGENKVVEALEKIESAPKEAMWHFIGNLQKNKVKKIIGKFDLIHSVDSLSLAQKISKHSSAAGITTPILLQVNTSMEESKNGLTSEEWLQQFEEVQQLPFLAIEGLMTIAPLTNDASIIRRCFKETKWLLERLNEKREERPLMKQLSMGMTNDYPIAIQEGATLLRIGSAIFGERSKVK